MVDKMRSRRQNTPSMPQTWKKSLQRTVSENGRPSAGPVPLRGLLISAGALVAALLAGAFFTDSIDQDQDLVWSLAVIPALLLAYLDS